MRIFNSLKLKLIAGYLVILAIIILFFIAFGYFILNQNVFLITQEGISIKSARFQSTAPDSSTEYSPSADNWVEDYGSLGGYALFAEDVAKIKADGDFQHYVNTPMGIKTIDLTGIFPDEVKEGLEIWLYGRYSADNPNFYEIVAITQNRNNIGVLSTYQKVVYSAAVMAIVICGIVGFFWIKHLFKPLDKITNYTDNLKEQTLDNRLNINSHDELGRLAESLNQASSQLEKSFKQKELFSAEASHAMRAPLAVIQSETELAMNRSHTPTEYQNSLKNIAYNLSKLDAMVRKMMVLTSADREIEELQFERIDLSKLLLDLAEDARILGENKNLKVEVTLEPGIMIRGNIQKLNELFLNLLENAVKYTYPDGKISISLTRSDNQAVVSITDTGTGIAQKHLEHIFEAFYKVKSSVSDENPGSGLGLAICKHIVDLHQGTIEVNSREGHGSTFTVRLP